MSDDRISEIREYHSKQPIAIIYRVMMSSNACLQFGTIGVMDLKEGRLCDWGSPIGQTRDSSVTLQYISPAP